MKTRMFTFEIMWLILAAIQLRMEAPVFQASVSDLPDYCFSADVIAIKYWPVHVRPPPDSLGGVSVSWTIDND